MTASAIERSFSFRCQLLHKNEIGLFVSNLKLSKMCHLVPFLTITHTKEEELTVTVKRKVIDNNIRTTVTAHFYSDLLSALQKFTRRGMDGDVLAVGNELLETHSRCA